MSAGADLAVLLAVSCGSSGWIFSCLDTGQAGRPAQSQSTGTIHTGTETLPLWRQEHTHHVSCFKNIVMQETS